MNIDDEEIFDVGVQWTCSNVSMFILLTHMKLYGMNFQYKIFIPNMLNGLYIRGGGGGGGG